MSKLGNSTSEFYSWGSGVFASRIDTFGKKWMQLSPDQLGLKARIKISYFKKPEESSYKYFLGLSKY
jgi:hypothetical protein